MLKNLFREVAIKDAPKQEVMVDSITEESPILDMLPMQAASNGLHNLYEDLKDIEGAKVVNLDEALPDIGADGEVKQIDLSVLGGSQEVGEDKAGKMGGPAAYFAGKMPAILSETGSNVETSLIYNSILPYAKENGRMQDAGGTNDGNMFSMCCVKWVPGETTGLYDPSGFGNGKLFDVAPLNGGNIYKDKDGVIVYGQRIKTYLGVQLVNPRNVSAIANIDLVIDTESATGYTALPTEAQIDTMITEARGNPANTFLYMHQKVKNALNGYKGSALETNVMDTDYNRTFDMWNGFRIITSYNFSENEATEVFA